MCSCVESMKATLRYNADWDLDRNARTLVNVMRSEGAAHATSGYWFDYGLGENAEHKRYCKAMLNSAWFMVQAARNSGSIMLVGRNMNNQMAVWLKTESTHPHDVYCQLQDAKL